MSHYYYCDGDYEEGGKKCIYVPGPPLERAVLDAVLARLAPAELESVRAAFEKAKSEEPIEMRRQEKQLQELQRHADELKYRLFKVDPDNRLVAAVLERDYEAALRELDALKRRMADERLRPSSFVGIDIDDIMRALEDPLPVFLAPTTSDHDRKLIIRFLVAAVVIEEKTLYIVRARIVWVDGVPDTRIEVRLPLYPHLVIEEMTAQGSKPKEIKYVLDGMKLTTSKGNRWTLGAIALRRHVMKRAKLKDAISAHRSQFNALEKSE
jgi:hypothetical protein